MTEVPEGVDLAQPAGIGVAGVTAWETLHARAELAADDRVLVLGASGGVGSIAVQLADGTGAVVWGQTTQADKMAAIEEGGADRVVVVADAGGLVDAVAELEPTVILDGLGGAYTAASVEALVPLGRLVVYGTSADQSTLNLRVLYRKGSLLGYGGLVVAEESGAGAGRPSGEVAEDRCRSPSSWCRWTRRPSATGASSSGVSPASSSSTPAPERGAPAGAVAPNPIQMWPARSIRPSSEEMAAWRRMLRAIEDSCSSARAA